MAFTTDDIKTPIPQQGSGSHLHGDVVLGEDWTDPGAIRLDREPGMRGIVALNRSPLARKIITFNLMALVVLVAGVLYVNPFRDGLVQQRESALVTEAELIASALEARLDGVGPQVALDAVVLPGGVEAYLMAPSGALLATSEGGSSRRLVTESGDADDRTLVTDMLSAVWRGIAGLAGQHGVAPPPERPGREIARDLLYSTTEVPRTERIGTPGGGLRFWALTPIDQGAILAISTRAGEIDRLVRNEREEVLQMFVIAIAVSIGLSLVLASTIANPLSELSAAAEVGQDMGSRKGAGMRVRIPDLTARPDEIGRLSGALRGLVGALYDRIDTNEQFAADVAHEIKNPLASLRSAVGTLHFAKRDDQRARLLEVIEHDVRRLDRLVTDISNASRLDAELVKEEEETFDLLTMLSNLAEYLGGEAEKKGVDFLTDFPKGPIEISGLEGRLAQVFVNLISNASSFCGAGDAIRVWVRKRENRVLIVVEDTGPGIPDGALHKVFNRFYTERPDKHFGDNSGLGLSISKQIVEAHGGVIWAENIRREGADPSGPPLGARFVVGLPV